MSQQQNMMQDYIRTSTYQRAMLDNTADFHDKVVYTHTYTHPDPSTRSYTHIQTIYMHPGPSVYQQAMLHNTADFYDKVTNPHPDPSTYQRAMLDNAANFHNKVTHRCCLLQATLLKDLEKRFIFPGPRKY